MSMRIGVTCEVPTKAAPSRAVTVAIGENPLTAVWLGAVAVDLSLVDERLTAQGKAQSVGELAIGRILALSRRAWQEATAAAQQGKTGMVRVEGAWK